MENETHSNVLEALFDSTTDYIETRADLIKLKAVKKSSELISGVVSQVIVFVFLCFFLILANIALALWLGEMFGHNYFGFLAVAGFYLIVGLIIYAGRTKWLKVPVANSMIKKIHS